jgi:hypothetical protein
MKSMNKEITIKRSYFYILFSSFIVIFIIAIWALILEHNTTKQLEECRAEATAWYNANATQSDETAKWFLQGQQPGTLDYTISQMYAKEGHDLGCIEPRPFKE